MDEIPGVPIWVPLNKTAEQLDREFTLEMAEHVWQKVKGYPIPECYSVEDRLSIFERYYHRASAQSQGE
jgi:glucose-6-phosphate isomerase